MVVARDQRNGGALMALVSAAFTAGLVWAPWVKPPIGATEGLSGWDLHEVATGSARWYVGDAFGSGFSPFFPGLPVLVGAIAVAVMALILLAIRTGVRRGVGGVMRFIAVLATLLWIVDFGNVVMSPDSVRLQWGLIGFGLTSVCGALGILAATGMTRIGKAPKV